MRFQPSVPFTVALTLAVQQADFVRFAVGAVRNAAVSSILRCLASQQTKPKSRWFAVERGVGCLTILLQEAYSCSAFGYWSFAGFFHRIQ
jgi:hypothetical protein